MKKFLTVLLALSVVFTYSFGTVFAADPVSYTLLDVESAITTQANTVNGQIDTAKTYVLSQFSTKTISGGAANISKASYETVLEAVVAAEKQKVQTNANYSILAARSEAADPNWTSFSAIQKINFESYVSTGHTYTVGGQSLTTVAIANNSTNLEALATDIELGKAEYAKVKAEALTKVNALVLANYSQVIPANGAVSNYASAAAIQKTAQDAINGTEVLATETSVSKAALQIKTINDAVTAYEADIKLVPTIADESAADADLQTVKGYAITKLQGEANVAYQTKLATLQNELIGLERATPVNATAVADKKAEIDGLKAKYDAFVQVETYKINALTAKGDILDIDNKVKSNLWGTINDAAVTTAAGMVANVEKLEAEAKLVAMYTDANGKALYATETIQSKLEAAIGAVYSGTPQASLGLKADDTAEKALAQRKVELLTGSAIYVNKIAYNSVEKWTPTAGAVNFFDTQLAEAKQIIKDTKEAIEAAKTIAAADEALVAGYTKYDAVQSKADQDALFATGKPLKVSLDKYVANLDAYVTYKFASTDTSKLAGDASALKAIDLKGEAYTEADLLANYNAAVALVDGLQTKTSLDDQAKAINAKILAINPKVTVADKATVVALKDEVKALKDYCTKVNYPITVVLNETLLNSYATTIQAAEAKLVKDAYDVLNAKTITVADKDAIVALRAARDAYYDEYEVDVTGADDANIKALEGKLQDAQVVDLVAKINALPTTITLADKADVEAARAAYDALPAAKQGNGNVQNLAVLLNAEAQLAVAEKEAGNVKSLSVKATTKKVGKKVRVYFKNVPQQIKDLGDNAYIQVWKSKNAVKYKFSKRAKITAKSTLISKTYNGKNYVKFRVVVVNEDGTKTFSPWSTVGCRIIRK